MRILQLIDSLETGGAERMAVNIANALTEVVDKSFLCATRKEGLLKEFLNEDVGYLFLNKKSALDLKAVFLFRKFIIQNKINVLHAHSSSFFLAVLTKLTCPKLKIVWHDHYGNSELLPQRKSLVLKMTSFFFSVVISVNTKLKDWAELSLKCKRIFFIPNFAERTLTGVPTVMEGEDLKRIVCLANLRPQKDHITLIDAFKIINKKHQDWTLHFIGKEFEDAYQRIVRKRVYDLKLDSKIFFYGSVKNTHDMLSKCDIGVLSSKSEGLPLALLEYGLNGLAVVVTDVGECKMIINDTTHGTIVPPENPKKMAHAILELIEHKEIRLDKSKNFQTYIENNYTKTAFIARLIKVYETI